MKSRTQEPDPGIVIFGIVTLRAGRRPVDWSFNSLHVGPYISVDGERAEVAMMEIASELADPELVRLLHPTLVSDSPWMATAKDGVISESKYFTLVFDEERLRDAARRMWDAFRPRWQGVDL